MNISILHPLYLLLLLAIPLFWFLPRRAPDWRQASIRSTLLVLLVLALARPVILSPHSEVHQVFIIDRSESVTVEQLEQAEDTLQTLLDQLPADDKVSLIIVGQPETTENGDLPEGDIYISGDSTSSLSAALEAASQEIPEGSAGAITLVSDGLATDRNWGSTIQTLIRRGIPVNTLDLGQRADDIFPSAINLVGDLRVGQTARLNVDVIGRGADLQVRLSGPEGELALSDFFESAGRITVTLEFEPSEAGYLDLTAEVIVPETKENRPPQDRYPDNNEITKAVAVQAPIRVLYLGGRQLGAAAKLAELVGRGYDVTDGSAETLDRTFDLNPYDLVMVDDRPAEKLPVAFQERLVDAIRTRGLGLMFSGGKASFGSGGYDGSKLAEALPVDFEQQDEKRDPSVSLAVIIDTSASMMGKPIDIAKQISRLAIRRLQPHDRVGIVEFYGAKQWAFPMQPPTNTIAIERAIARMQPGGGTVLYPAIEEAYYGLKNMRTRYKHILLITDAMVEDADFETIARRIASNGIALSTIVVGENEIDGGGMFALATWGKGRYYSVSDRFSLPDIILKQPSTTSLPAYRSGEFPLTGRGGRGWWGSVDFAAIPPVGGYAKVGGRPGAEVLIEEEEMGHPILASWQHGLGRVTSLMTEPLGIGTSSWQDWDDYGEMLGRILSRTGSDQEPFSFAFERNNHEIRVIARRRNGDYATRPKAIAFPVKTEGSQSGMPLEFLERAPDLFEAKVVVNLDAEVRVSAGVEEQDSYSSLRLVSVAREDVYPETQVDPQRGLDMAMLAQVTSGEAILLSVATGINLDDLEQKTALTVTSLSPYLLILALLTYLGELTHRRWPKTAATKRNR